MKQIWQEELKKWAIDRTGVHPRTISVYLGQWNHTVGTWYWHEFNQEIYWHTDSSSWERWAATPGKPGRSPTYSKTGVMTTTPEYTHQAQITRLNEATIQLHSIAGSHQPAVTSNYTAGPIWGISELKEVQSDTPESEWRTRNPLTDITVVSDGSAKDSLLSYGFIIHDRTTYRDIRGSGMILSHPDDVSSFRAELGGILEGIKTINQLEDQGACWKSINFYADNATAIEKATEALINPNDSNRDLRDQLWKELSKTRSPVSFQWIRGHQDQKMDYNFLSYESKLNVIADKLAEKKWKEARNHGILTKEPQLNPSLVQLSFNHRLITCTKRASVYRMISTHSAMEYWSTRLGWAQNTPALVWWEGIGKAARGQPKKQQIGMVKLATGHAAVAHKMVQWKFSISNQCPFCTEIETIDHVFQCRHPGNTAHRSLAFDQLRKHLKKKRTATNITTMILQALKAWSENRSFIPNGLLRAWGAAENQTKIGWQQFLLGKISKKWIDIQARYLLQVGSKKSAFNWATELIRRLWKIAWQLWKYRCDFAHSKDSNWYASRVDSISSQVRAEFSRGKQGATGLHARWWKQPVEQILSLSLEAQERWLESVRGVREKTRQAGTQLIQQQRTIRNWLSQNIK